jgi:hypothetical protein
MDLSSEGSGCCEDAQTVVTNECRYRWLRLPATKYTGTPVALGRGSFGFDAPALGARQSNSPTPRISGADQDPDMHLSCIMRTTARSRDSSRVETLARRVDLEAQIICSRLVPTQDAVSS